MGYLYLFYLCCLWKLISGHVLFHIRKYLVLVRILVCLLTTYVVNNVLLMPMLCFSLLAIFQVSLGQVLEFVMCVFISTLYATFASLLTILYAFFHHIILSPYYSSYVANIGLPPVLDFPGCPGFFPGCPASQQDQPSLLFFFFFLWCCKIVTCAKCPGF